MYFNLFPITNKLCRYVLVEVTPVYIFEFTVSCALMRVMKFISLNQGSMWLSVYENRMLRTFEENFITQCEVVKCVKISQSYGCL